VAEFSHTNKKTERARELRRDATLWERLVWSRLRGAKLGGFTFRRQHYIGPYFVDFYCSAAKLAVELDGSQHTPDEGYDADRTRYLNANGIQVLRFWNEEIKTNLEGAVETIYREAVRRTPTRSASRSDLPLSGGGVKASPPNK
jgi:very-short-patch-repair endonuclease